MENIQNKQKLDNTPLIEVNNITKSFINSENKELLVLDSIDFKLEEVLFIKKEAWHQIINPYDVPCHIIEIQYGEATVEEDIERLSYYEEQK